MSKEGADDDDGESGTELTYPTWVGAIVSPGEHRDEEGLMRCVIRVALENIARTRGGPFAALTATRSGRVISIGFNEVVPRADCTAHAEVMAIRRAGAALATWKLDRVDDEDVTLLTSCAPCILCTGAIHWSGISRVVAAARPRDAAQAGFVEGPEGFSAPDALARSGVVYVPDLLREEALEVFRRYDGAIYNG